MVLSNWEKNEHNSVFLLPAWVVSSIPGERKSLHLSFSLRMPATPAQEKGKILKRCLWEKKQKQREALGEITLFSFSVSDWEEEASCKIFLSGTGFDQRSPRILETFQTIPMDFYCIKPLFCLPHPLHPPLLPLLPLSHPSLLSTLILKLLPSNVLSHWRSCWERIFIHTNVFRMLYEIFLLSNHFLKLSLKKKPTTFIVPFP